MCKYYYTPIFIFLCHFVFIISFGIHPAALVLVPHAERSSSKIVLYADVYSYDLGSPTNQRPVLSGSTAAELPQGKGNPRSAETHYFPGACSRRAPPCTPAPARPSLHARSCTPAPARPRLCGRAGVRGEAGDGGGHSYPSPLQANSVTHRARSSPLRHAAVHLRSHCTAKWGLGSRLFSARTATRGSGARSRPARMRAIRVSGLFDHPCTLRSAGHKHAPHIQWRHTVMRMSS